MLYLFGLSYRENCNWNILWTRVYIKHKEQCFFVRESTGKPLVGFCLSIYWRMCVLNCENQRICQSHLSATNSLVDRSMWPFGSSEVSVYLRVWEQKIYILYISCIL